MPSLLQMQSGKKITLGLDLQGGLHMLLGVKTDEATASRIKSITASIKHFTEKQDILIDDLKFSNNEVSFKLLDSDDKKTIKEFLDTLDGLKTNIDGENISLMLTKKR